MRKLASSPPAHLKPHGIENSVPRTVIRPVLLAWACVATLSRALRQAAKVR
jgi:hypothetical protein